MIKRVHSKIKPQLIRETTTYLTNCKSRYIKQQNHFYYYFSFSLL